MRKITAPRKSCFISLHALYDKRSETTSLESYLHARGRHSWAG